MKYYDKLARDSALPQDRGSPSKFRASSTASMRNNRKRMENRHVVLHDLADYVSSHLQYKVLREQHISYYAVYDGHAGVKAASTSAFHMHEKLVDSQHFETNPQQAIGDAIKAVDKLICDTPEDKSGATVALALIKDRMLYVGWPGDSQSVLARNGHAIRLVDPHMPNREDEKTRIQELGGWVNFWGTWRVNGTLAVSRAVGDAELKPYVSNECDVTTVQLGDQDDFLIVACDGLWDGLTFDEAVQIVYDHVSTEDNHLQPEGEPNTVEELSSVLSKAAMEKGSTENITVIVVFLRDINLIRKDINNRPTMENLLMGITSTSEFVENLLQGKIKEAEASKKNLRAKSGSVPPAGYAQPGPQDIAVSSGSACTWSPATFSELSDQTMILLTHQ